MSLGRWSTADLPTQDGLVNVAGMATVVRALVDHKSLRGADELRERALATGLNEHECAALLALCSKLERGDSAFLDRFSTDGW